MQKKTIAVYGDSQAEAVSLVLSGLPAVSAEFEIAYFSGSAANSVAPQLQEGSIVCEQQPGESSLVRAKAPQNIRRVRFPRLAFNLLWPFNCINPFNKPEPPLYPFGRFPYGDSFIVSCINRGVSADTILDYYSAAEWPPTWPNLDKLFQVESARLSAQDGRNNVKIGSFALKYFRKRRLFWAANGPANKLLAELVYRLLHAMLGAEQPIGRAQIEDVLFHFGPRDLLGAMSVPVHPLVARHFGLEWYAAGDLYAYFGERELTYEQYFSEMIEQALAFKSAVLAT